VTGAIGDPAAGTGFPTAARRRSGSGIWAGSGFRAASLSRCWVKPGGPRRGWGHRRPSDGEGISNGGAAAQREWDLGRIRFPRRVAESLLGKTGWAASWLGPSATQRRGADFQWRHGDAAGAGPGRDPVPPPRRCVAAGKAGWGVSWLGPSATQRRGRGIPTAARRRSASGTWAGSGSPAASLRRCGEMEWAVSPLGPPTSPLGDEPGEGFAWVCWAACDMMTRIP
jgi:hypothetical protein